VSNVMESSELSKRRNTMNWSIKEVARVLLVVAILAGGTLFGTSDVWALETGSSLAQQIQGTWILVSIYNEKDGKRIEQFGPNPRGIHIFTPEGYVTQIMMPESLPKIASGNRKECTPEECRAVATGVIAWIGKYTVNEKDKEVNYTIQASSFPNFEGTPQKRTMTIEGDMLKLVNPTTALGTGVNYSTWKRVK